MAAENERRALKPKRRIKDSVFTDLFRNKKYLLELYQALHPEDTTATEDDLQDITLQHILINGDYNDLGFSVGGRIIILVESQSTWTYNIIIRAMLYLAQTYLEYYERVHANLYGSRRVPVPVPELYVIYTGEQIKSEGKEIPDIIAMRDAFFGGKETAVDIRVKVLRTATEQDIIGQYIIFAKVYNEQRKLYGETQETVTETIRICKDRNVLKAYLESKEKEVVDIMKLLFDEDTIYENYVLDERRDAAEQASRRTAANFIRKGKNSLEDIADATGLSLDEVKEIEAEVFQLA